MEPLLSFPDTLPVEPATARRNVEPVGGTFAVTATLPTLDDIVDWQEGMCAFDYGYYRFIDHPFLRQIQAGLEAHCEVRHSLVYGSLQAAVCEVLEYVLSADPGATVRVVSDAEDTAPFSLDDALAEVEASVCTTVPDTLGASDLFSEDVLLIAVHEAFVFLEEQAAWLHAARARRVPVVVVLDRLPAGSLPSLPVTYWLAPLHDRRSPVTGAAVLSNAGRQMNELQGRRKRHGPILSSRNAAFFLGQLSAPTGSYAESVVRRLCALEHARHGFLFSSGMQAITTLLGLVQRPGKAQVIAVGHLYTDTYTLLRYAAHRDGEADNVFLGVDELDGLPEAVTEQTAAIFTETITNPLNDVPDLAFIVEVARRHGIPVIVDNTFATPIHCNPLAWGADYVVHSTTKYFSGKNDHAGGAVLVSDDEAADALRQTHRRRGSAMSPLESEVLWERLQDFEDRMQRFQANADRVVVFLDAHPAVDRVYFSGLPSHRCYAVAQRQLEGSGSVISFTLKQPGRAGLRRFYDAPLPAILKAPSLGSNQTMVCPYTLLAHYHEPDEVLEEWGLPRYLIRLAVGCETEIQPVIDALDRALRVAEKEGK